MAFIFEDDHNPYNSGDGYDTELTIASGHLVKENILLLRSPRLLFRFAVLFSALSWTGVIVRWLLMLNRSSFGATRFRYVPGSPGSLDRVRINLIDDCAFSCLLRHVLESIDNQLPQRVFGGRILHVTKTDPDSSTPLLWVAQLLKPSWTLPHQGASGDGALQERAARLGSLIMYLLLAVDRPGLQLSEQWPPLTPLLLDGSKRKASIWQSAAVFRVIFPRPKRRLNLLVFGKSALELGDHKVLDWQHGR
ncbi:hypothetical protein P154DRAFT_580643 [Amniculicola lignicola CBS 123094]|uniref:Uncharacterized protein n=1 Tax=Amniculicola lignicola CBS 123094 TaxID=1392246 RepID=A0A6A5W171_9PLEO|nr:hypothetical protein P154DRAFT_580643 [Amniculicola lignicola CBS 123094]